MTGGFTTPAQGVIYSPFLASWNGARGRMRATGANARILCIGDSTTAGFGANAAFGYTGAKALSFPTALAAALSNSGLPSMEASFMGCNQTQVSVPAYDPRLTIVSGWAVSTLNSVGKAGFDTTTSGATLRFAPTQTVDRVDVFYVDGPNGSIAVNIGSGTVGTISPTGGTLKILKQTISFTRGVRTINFVTGDSNYQYILGVVAYDSTTRTVDVMNGGWDASKTSDWNVTFQNYDPLPSAVSIAPDLYILNLSINDMNSGTAIGTFTTQTNAIVATLKAVSDILIVLPQSLNPSTGSYASLVGPYTSYLYDLASTNGMAVLDISKRQGTFAQETSNGMVYDDLHPSAAGYSDIASAISQLLTK